MSERGERGRGKMDKGRVRRRGGGGYTDSMQVRPKKQRILHRCHKSRWTVWNADVHCVGE